MNKPVSAVKGRKRTASTIFWNAPLNIGTNPMAKPTGMAYKIALMYPPKLSPMDLQMFINNSFSTYKSLIAVTTLHGFGTVSYTHLLHFKIIKFRYKID